MRKTCSALIIFIFAVFLSGCTSSAEAPSNADAIQSYIDIPGITQEEIDSVESLKSIRDGFSFGHLNTIESFQYSNENPMGFTGDVCDLLSELFGMPFTPKAYDKWPDLKNDIDDESTDFSGEFTYTSERAQTYIMTTPIAERGLNVYSLTSNPEIIDENDLEDMRVGFLGAKEVSAKIVSLYPDVSFEMTEVFDFEEAADMLASHEIDAFITDEVSNTIFENYDDIRSKNIFQFATSPISITTKNDELKAIISVINKYLSAGGMEKIYDLYNKNYKAYKKYMLSQDFTAEEQAYLADLKSENSKVNVALMHDAYPASFYNTVENRYDGAAYDILQQLSELTEIEFNSDYMPVEKSLSEILVKLKAGKVSMMPQLLYSESRKDDYIWSDTSYITTNFALLSKDSYPDLKPFQVYYATVGIVEKSVHAEVFQDLFPGHANTKSYPTGDTAFEALESGEIDLLMLSETMLLVQTNYREKLGYKINLTFNKTLDTLYGFNKDETVLRDIFDKSLRYIDVKGIEGEWLSKTYDYQRKRQQDAIPYTIAICVLLLLAFFVVSILYFKNRKLSKNLEKTVSERTRDLENKTATLSTIYKSIPDLVFCKDVNGRYTSCNPSFEEFAGMTEAEILGKNDIEVFKIDEEMAEAFIQADRKVLNSSKLERLEEPITYPNGTQRLAETVKTPLIKNGTVIGMMGISRDITERKEMEDGLIEAKEAAEESSRAKSVFLSRMSHEMRTPMNAIIGMTNIGKDAGDIEKKDYCLDKISSASTHLLGVINDVLDISKIEAGKFEIQKEAFNLKNMIDKLTSVISFRLEEKELNFTVEIDNNVPAVIISDEQRLSQVITNLLGNAVKFTPDKGSIWLYVRNEAKDGDTYTIQFEVKDTGIGISKDDNERLFKSFEQADGGISRQYGGTGLGLSISKQIVEMLDGQIWVNSKLGEGSSFIFNIITQKSDSKKLKSVQGLTSEGQAYISTDPEDFSSFEGKCVLLAEDVEINREIVITMLESTGLQIDCAENGKIACEMFKDNPKYDVILMDIHMPEMDGYTATRIIRNLEIPWAKKVPIIAMTANVFREDIEKCMEAGMNAHIGKPIDFDDMVAKLRAYLDDVYIVRP